MAWFQWGVADGFPPPLCRTRWFVIVASAQRRDVRDVELVHRETLDDRLGALIGECGFSPIVRSREWLKRLRLDAGWKDDLAGRQIDRGSTRDTIRNEWSLARMMSLCLSMSSIRYRARRNDGRVVRLGTGTPPTTGPGDEMHK